MFIWDPKQGIFYLDIHNQMCFQHADDLHAAPTEHLFHLYMECMGHKEFNWGYHVLISLELNKCLE